MPKVLEDALDVILVGHAIIVDIEHARLTLIALHANENFPVPSRTPGSRSADLGVTRNPHRGAYQKPTAKSSLL
jgi:hypothetical protein